MSENTTYGCGLDVLGAISPAGKKAASGSWVKPSSGKGVTPQQAAQGAANLGKAGARAQQVAKKIAKRMPRASQKLAAVGGRAVQKSKTTVKGLVIFGLRQLMDPADLGTTKQGGGTKIPTGTKPGGGTGGAKAPTGSSTGATSSTGWGKTVSDWTKGGGPSGKAPTGGQYGGPGGAAPVVIQKSWQIFADGLNAFTDICDFGGQVADRLAQLQGGAQAAGGYAYTPQPQNPYGAPQQAPMGPDPAFLQVGQSILDACQAAVDAYDEGSEDSQSQTIAAAQQLKPAATTWLQQALNPPKGMGGAMPFDPGTGGGGGGGGGDTGAGETADQTPWDQMEEEGSEEMNAWRESGGAIDPFENVELEEAVEEGSFELADESLTPIDESEMSADRMLLEDDEGSLSLDEGEEVLGGFWDSVLSYLNADADGSEAIPMPVSQSRSVLDLPRFKMPAGVTPQQKAALIAARKKRIAAEQNLLAAQAYRKIIDETPQREAVVNPDEFAQRYAAAQQAAYNQE